MFIEQSLPITSVGNSIINNQVQNSQFNAVLARYPMCISNNLNEVSFAFFAVSLNSINETCSICTLMFIRPVFDEIPSMVKTSLCQSLMIFKWLKWFLIDQEVSSLLPCSHSLHSPIKGFLIQFDVEVIFKRIDLFIKERHVVFRILTCKVQIFHYLLSRQTHSLSILNISNNLLQASQ